MTDDFNTRLSERLERVAAAVPVAERALLAPATSRVRPRTSGRRLAIGGFVPVLAIIVVGILVADVAKLGPFAGSTNGPHAPSGAGANTAKSIAGPFSLELRADRHTYHEDEPISITATFRYAHDVPPTTLLSRSSELIGFGIEEPVHGMAVATRHVSLLSCSLPIARSLQPGEAMATPFEKGGEPAVDGPASALQRAFLADPVLRLPAGVWHIYASASLSEVDHGCNTVFTLLRPVIEIEVLPAVARDASAPPPSDAPAPSPSRDPRRGQIQPDGSTLAEVDDGTFALSIETGNAVVVADQPIPVVTRYRYIGAEDEVKVSTHGPAVAFHVVQLDATNPTGTSMLLYPTCDAHRLSREVDVGVPLEYVELAEGEGVGDGWVGGHLEGSSLRLPAGNWRITAHFRPFDGGTCDGPKVHNLAASIDVSVVDAEGNPPTRGAMRSGGYELAIATERTTYPAGAWIDPLVTLTNVGVDGTPQVLAGSPLVVLALRQVDGPGVVEMELPDGCGAFGLFERDRPHEMLLTRSRSMTSGWPDEQEATYLALGDGPLALPPGTWTITAQSRLFGPACDQPTAIELRAQVTVTILP